MRQQILIGSFDGAHAKDLACNFKHRCDEDWAEDDLKAPNIEKRAHRLGALHPEIEMEMIYVIEQRKKMLGEDWPEFEEAEEMREFEKEHDEGACDRYW